MKKFAIALFALLAFAASAVAQEGLMDKLARLEANSAAIDARIASIDAMLTRQKADIANLQSSIDELRSEVKALAKTSGVTFTRSAPDWAGDRTITATSATFTAAPAYSSGGFSAAPMRRGIFGRLRGGGCAGGG